MLKKIIAISLCIILCLVSVVSYSGAAIKLLPVSITQGLEMVSIGELTTLDVVMNITSYDTEDLVWSSSNENIATVNEDGVIRPTDAGYTDITATIYNSSGKKLYSDTCKLYVYTPAVLVTIDYDTLDFTVSQKSTFTANVKTSYPVNTRIVWGSSDNEVAIIDSKGNFHARAEGEATLTCSVIDNKSNKAIAKNYVDVTVHEDVTEISLSNEAVSLQLGDTHKLEADIASNAFYENDVVFSSSNEDVALVDSDGVITAKDTGNATITCSFVNIERNSVIATETCEVIVGTSVEKITLDKTSLSMAVGKSYTLKDTVSPSTATNKDVKWTSSNTKVATVNSNGTVTAVGKGTTTITCTAQDGSNVKTSIKMEVYQKVESVALNKTTVTLNQGKTYTLKATISPSTANNQGVVWYTSNSSVVKVDANGKLTGVGGGTATITVRAKENSKILDTVTVTVKPTVSYTEDDLYCMAAVIWQEAGALYMSDELQLMVGAVVMNHVASSYFPNTIRGVLTRPYAYGTMAWDGIHLPTNPSATTQKAIDRCYENAKKVLTGEFDLPNNVIYQAGFVQGSGVYKYLEGVYFCYM